MRSARKKNGQRCHAGRLVFRGAGTGVLDWGLHPVETVQLRPAPPIVILGPPSKLAGGAVRVGARRGGGHAAVEGSIPSSSTTLRGPELSGAGRACSAGVGTLRRGFNSLRLHQTFVLPTDSSDNRADGLQCRSFKAIYSIIALTACDFKGKTTSRAHSCATTPCTVGRGATGHCRFRGVPVELDSQYSQF